jgi:hypothetical protein
MVTNMSDLRPNALIPGSPLARRAAVVSCWLCGIRLHQNQMVPDGSGACPDIRWYCKDAEACTERWTSDQRHKRFAEAASPGQDMAGPSLHAAELSADSRPSKSGLLLPQPVR